MMKKLGSKPEGRHEDIICFDKRENIKSSWLMYPSYGISTVRLDLSILS